MRHVFAIACAVLLYALPVVTHAYAFFGQPNDANGSPLPLQTPDDNVDPIVWPDNRAEVAMTMNFGDAFNDSMVSAMQDSWNDVGTRLQFREGVIAALLCNNDDGVNAAGWRTTVCGGGGFGDALAVTVVTHTRRGSGVWELSDTDIVLDSSRQWVLNDNPQPGQYDFRRVIIHELGHALGLEHPDEVPGHPEVDAIMNSRVSAIVTLQDDDIAGLNYLYGGAGSSTVSQRDSGGADTTLPLLALLGWGMRRIRSRRGHVAAGRGGL
jgi:hypothetical protein